MTTNKGQAAIDRAVRERTGRAAPETMQVAAILAAGLLIRDGAPAVAMSDSAKTAVALYRRVLGLLVAPETDDQSASSGTDVT